jgi:hypothetical protein
MFEMDVTYLAEGGKGGETRGMGGERETKRKETESETKVGNKEGSSAFWSEHTSRIHMAESELLSATHTLHPTTIGH